MTTTVVGVFNSDASAQSAVNQLRDIGVPMENISVIARPTGDIVNEAGETITLSDDHMTAGEGATVGAVWGGLVGLAALAIPGIGPLVTSNIFAAALTGVVAGAATGGIAGALIDAASVPEEHARVYEDRVRQGSTLVTAQVDDSLATQTRSILHESGAENFNWDDPNTYELGRSTATPVGTVNNSMAAAAGSAMGYDAATSRPDLDRDRGDLRSDEFVRSSAGYSNTGDTDPDMHNRVRNAMTDDQGDDTFRQADQAYDNSSKVGTVGGAAAGAVTGAAIGAAGGPIGSAIGATAGAITGAAAGAIGDTIGEEAESETGAFSPDNKAQYDRTADNVEDKARNVGNRIENATRDTGNAVERGLNADIDNDGDVGRRY